MTKRVMVIRGFVLLLVIGIGTTFKLVTARAAVSVAVLQPTEPFQVQGLDSFRLTDVAAYNGDLFLLLNGPDGSGQILRVTKKGDIVRTIPLPTLSPLQHFGQLCISQAGTLAVSFSRLGSVPQTTLLLYETDGALKTSFDTNVFNEIAFIGDDLVGVGATGITQLTSQSRFVPNASSLPLNFVDRIARVWTASLPQNRLAIVEPLSGRLQIVTMDSVVVAPIILKAPEIQGVARPQQPDPGVFLLVVHTIAASPNGNIYIGVTGGKRQEGAPVLQLDSSGMLTNRLKCILPTFGQDPSNHQSYMYAKRLVATNDSLFWISESEKKVAVYSLENVH